ncbi:hypothetical protein JM18_005183 [Phytophthora kernoviae]|nr:hypothetical protein JM18_005183 [Phytophthora kernoviae]
MAKNKMFDDFRLNIAFDHKTKAKIEVKIPKIFWHSNWDGLGKNADDVANMLRADKASDEVIDILPQIFTMYKQLEVDKAKEAAIALAKRAGTS